MIDVVLASDDKLFKYSKVVIKSAMQYCTDEIKFHILTRNIDEPKLNIDTNIQYYKINKKLTVNLLRHITISTMDRLFIPELIDSDKVIYLDIDTMVFDDLVKLYNYPTGDCGLAAVRGNYKYVADFAAKSTELLLLNKIREKFGECINFNAGVLLMDLKKLRINDFTQKALEYVSEYKANDQIAMSLYSNNRFYSLLKRWNVINNNTKDIAIKHWIGPNKPWNSDVMYKNIWQKFYAYRIY